MPRQLFSLEVKAAAIADLASGEQPAVVAQRYGLNRQTVKSWRIRSATDVQPAAQPDMQPLRHPTRFPIVEARQETLTDLVLQNLRAKLIATQRIAEHAATTAWLDKQTAADVAELFECLDRSAVTILDRLAVAQERSAIVDDGDAGVLDQQ